MKLTTACAAAALALGLSVAASSASAQEVDVSFNAALTSDYVFRGFSQTSENAAVQAGVDVTIGSFYAGAWASNVDFGDNTDAEIDIYGGFRGEAGGFAWDGGVVFYGYAPGANSDYDYVELKGAISRAIGPVTAGAAVYFSPDFFGVDDEATYYEVNAAFAPMEKLSVTGALGQQMLSVSDDYVTWNVGATYALDDGLGLDVRYHDTDIDADVPIASERFVVTLKATF